MQPLIFGPVVISRLNIGIVVIAVLLVAGFVLLFHYTTLGTAMRGTSQNQTAAWLVGISVPKMFSVIWALSAALAAAAGLLIAPLVLVRPDMGVIAIKAFVGAVLGGFNSLFGCLIGGLILGLLEIFGGVYFGGLFKDITAFVLLMFILLVRPHGIFGTAEARRV